MHCENIQERIFSESKKQRKTVGANIKAPTPTLGSLKSSLKSSSHMPPNSHIPIIPSPPPHVIGARPRARPWGGGGGAHGVGGVGIMGKWEFGGICKLFCKLLCKLPRVGVGAFLFPPTCVGMLHAVWFSQG